MDVVGDSAAHRLRNGAVPDCTLGFNGSINIIIIIIFYSNRIDIDESRAYTEDSNPDGRFRS